jgi:phosphoribosylformylglycinamidine synthase
MVGLVDSVARVTRSTFHPDAAADIVLLGEPTPEIGGSEYLAHIHGVVGGHPPACHVDAERALIDALLAAGQSGLVRSAHDVSDGGLAVALAECCVGDREQMVGADIDLSAWTSLPTIALLFGEGQGRIVVSTADAAAVVRIAKEHGVPARRIGTSRPVGTELRIAVAGATLRAALSDVADVYYGAIPRVMAGSPAVIQATEEPSPAESLA